MLVDVAVVGAGVVGSSAALSMSIAGYSVALVAPSSSSEDLRSSLLVGNSIELLRSVGVWDDIERMGKEINLVRLIDATNGLLHLPDVEFVAEELGLRYFGVNVINWEILKVLGSKIASFANINRIYGCVTAVQAKSDMIDLTVKMEHDDLCKERVVRAKLVVAADGRNSHVSMCCGGYADKWGCSQSALVCNVECELFSDDCGSCIELHHLNGPYVLVPVRFASSPRKPVVAAVLVDKSSVIMGLSSMSNEELSLILETRAHSIFGQMSVVGRRQVYPIMTSLSRRLTFDRVVLVGEAAHAFSPILAQGLNLGLRDVQQLGQIVREFSLGTQEMLCAYERLRRYDVKLRTYFIDCVNRLILSQSFPAQILRAVGLGLVSNVSLIRFRLMRALMWL